jgi:two-component system response regulator AtoC
VRILVIDDEESMRHLISVIFKREGYECIAVPDAKKALSELEAEDFDFVFCDMKMPVMDGLGFLKALKERSMDTTVIMMSAYGTMELALECMKLGAYDYISKPFNSDEIVLTVRKAEERERLKRENVWLRKEVKKGYDLASIVTKDAVMQEVLSVARKVSDYDTPVLITGESGTGKELVARAIHFNGARSGRPFVAINCGAIPRELLESELFGHVRGAFTDAVRNKQGLFQEAHAGTLFLDEIGELPVGLQVKLLRALQEGEIRRVGDTRAVKVDCRVVAATVKDLRQAIKDGLFREDLFFRLNVIEIRLPPLRERPADIPELCAHFIEKYSRKFGKAVKGVSKDALSALMAYQWPGNVRELENVIERAMILEDTDTITKGSVPMGAPLSSADDILAMSGLSIKRAEDAIERELIKKALVATGNNKTKAAELLEISHRALLYKIKSYGL